MSSRDVRADARFRKVQIVKFRYRQEDWSVHMQRLPAALGGIEIGRFFGCLNWPHGRTVLRTDGGEPCVLTANQLRRLIAALETALERSEAME